MNPISCLKRKKTQTSEKTTADPQALQRIYFAFSVKRESKRTPKRNISVWQTSFSVIFCVLLENKFDIF